MPKPSLGNDTTICEGAGLLLGAGVAADKYLWWDGDTMPQKEVKTGGDYWVKASSGD